jgi:hypothetical protein
LSANAKAPNCPEQNPIEDIWLQAKTWVRSRSVSLAQPLVEKRRFCALIPSFSHLKWMFEWFIRHTTFDFPALGGNNLHSLNLKNFLVDVISVSFGIAKRRTKRYSNEYGNIRRIPP